MAQRNHQEGFQHMNEFGVAGWLFSRPILRDKTMTLLELPGVVRDLDLDLLELCSAFFTSQSAAYLTEVRKAIDDAGVRIPNIAVDGPDISLEEDIARGVHLEATRQWFHVAHAVGSASIRVNSGGDVDASDTQLERIVEGYQSLAEMGEREGIRVLIENHGGASYKPRNIQYFLEAVGSPWFGSCPDAGNFPDGTWEEGIAVMAPYAQSTHIKVSAYSADGWQPRPGHDGVDRSSNLASILATLRDANYQGPYCIEQGVSEDDLAASATGAVSYVKQLLAEL
jgi:sugar phosphate isomerase/epimerase